MFKYHFRSFIFLGATFSFYLSPFNFSIFAFSFFLVAATHKTGNKSFYFMNLSNKKKRRDIF